MGNITEQRFKHIWESERYWDVMNYLASPEFNAQTMCGVLCLQHKVNEYLDSYVKGYHDALAPQGERPSHIDFV